MVMNKYEGLAGQVDSVPMMRQQRVQESIARNKKLYPTLQNIQVEGRYMDPNIKLHGGVLETQPPGARDEEGRLINDSNNWIINVGDFDDPRIKGNLDKAVLGDMLHTIRGNPEWAKMTNDVYSLRDEEQKYIDLEAYKRAVKERYGGDMERYPLSQFETYHRKDAYPRSVIAPDNNGENWTNPKQRKYIENNMIPFLKGEMVRRSKGEDGNG